MGERREGNTGARKRGQKGELEQGGEERRKHWSTEKRIKSLKDGRGKGKGGKPGALEHGGEKGALENGGEDQELVGWERGNREHWSTEEGGTGGVGVGAGV